MGCRGITPMADPKPQISPQENLKPAQNSHSAAPAAAKWDASGGHSPFAPAEASRHPTADPSTVPPSESKTETGSRKPGRNNQQWPTLLTTLLGKRSDPRKKAQQYLRSTDGIDHDYGLDCGREEGRTIPMARCSPAAGNLP